VLAALGVNVDLDPAGQARCLREAGLCFCFAIHHHPAMRFAAGPRRSLGFATVFNVLGPLTNPAGAERQLIGVYAPELVDKVAAALAGLGARRAVVVHGDGGGGDGMDEASTLGTTYVAHVHAGRVERVERADLARSGVERGARDELTARDVGHSAEMVRWAIGLGNREGSRAAREIVVLNAGLALVAGEAARDVADGIARAREAIESGRAASVLERLVAVSRGR
jgi:anthranilate phosphoribosyltransferase